MSASTLTQIFFFMNESRYISYSSVYHPPFWFLQAYHDAGVLEQCDRLLSQLAGVDLSPPTLIGLDITSTGVGLVPGEKKRAFVEYCQ